MSTHGHHMSPAQLYRFLGHIFQHNSDLQAKGQRGTSVMIWGTHGLGKPQSVVDYARHNQWKIAYCAPA